MYSPRTSVATPSMRLHKILASLLQVSTALKLLFVVGVAGILVYGDMQGWAFTKHFRLKIMDNTVPVWSVTHNATHWLHEKSQHIQHYFSVMQENQRLREQLEQLSHWKNIANQLATENEHLKHFLNVPTSSASTMVTARVITTPYTPSIQTLMINAGNNQGIRKNQPVIVPQGVVGRIIEVGHNSAQVLLITDPRSRIPVKGESSDFQAILIGNQTNALKILHHRTGEKAPYPQRLVTSSKGKVFPEGLIVAYVPDDTSPVIQPVVKWQDLDYVQVISAFPLEITHD
ncbi:MAG: rod shape-determining protein MreC [Pseudomonadota bacterium]